MSKAKTLYGDDLRYNDNSWRGAWSYTPIIDSFGDVVIRRDGQGWSSDTWVLYQRGLGYGYLRFGWGSCSGCDALQACDNEKEIDDLIDSLKNNIRWFPDAIVARDFFLTHDWAGDYDWYYEDSRLFVADVLRYFGVDEGVISEVTKKDE